MKQRTREENAAYQRKYRHDQKMKRLMSQGLAEPGVMPVERAATPQVPVARQVAPRPLSLAQKVAAGLAAPDDDCMSCGHDRQSYHLDGPCRMPTGPRARCGCPVFVSSAEPF